MLRRDRRNPQSREAGLNPSHASTKRWFGSTLVYNGSKRKKSPELEIEIHPLRKLKKVFGREIYSVCARGSYDDR